MRLLLRVAAAGLAASSCLWGGAVAIGVALTHGGITLDHVLHVGNTPVFEGSWVETGEASAQVQLTSGATLRMAPASRATLYAERVILEQGAVEFRGQAYEVDANTLRASGTSARITLRGLAVEVGAIATPVRVFNLHDVLVAALMAGQALELTPNRDDSVDSVLRGCLRQVNKAFLLTDGASNITAELRGAPDLPHDVGRRIQVSGTLLASAVPAKDASQVVQVGALKIERRTCSAAGVGVMGTAGALSGLSTTTAVVAGVVVTGVVVTPLGLLAAQSTSTRQDLSPVQ